MRFWRLKQWMALVLSVLLALALGAYVKGANALKLSDLSGTRTYYLDSASSQALIKTELSFADLFRVKGESVCFSLSTDTESEEDEYARSLAQRYGAEVLVVEETAETTSYYCYTTAFSGGVYVNGRKVNLHIAVGDGQCTVGSPIIFGGF